MYRKLSNGISWALHPFLLPLYMIGVLLTLTVFAHYPSGVKIYLLWVVVRTLNMELLSTILGQLISVGAIALIIVFQPELRRFLQVIGMRQKHFNFITRIFSTGFCRCWWAPCAMCCAPLRSPKFPPPSSCVSS